MLSFAQVPLACMLLFQKCPLLAWSSLRKCPLLACSSLRTAGAWRSAHAAAASTASLPPSCGLDSLSTMHLRALYRVNVRKDEVLCRQVHTIVLWLTVETACSGLQWRQCAPACSGDSVLWLTVQLLRRLSSAAYSHARTRGEVSTLSPLKRTRAVCAGKVGRPCLCCPGRLNNHGVSDFPKEWAAKSGIALTILCSDHIVRRQGGETMPAAQGALPEPPLFHGETKPSIQEIRAACRAYAEAAAAAQGFDLGMPSPDSRVVRCVAKVVVVAHMVGEVRRESGGGFS